jgi:uncharacterized protein YggU (UPF0235/DUF167 family)
MIRLSVRTHPGARQERAEVLPDGSLAVWVRAQPVARRANAALQSVLAERLGLRPGQVRLVAGASSRQKIVEIDVPNVDDVHTRLVAHGLRSSGP